MAEKDLELLTRLRESDRDAFRDLFTKYHQSLVKKWTISPRLHWHPGFMIYDGMQLNFQRAFILYSWWHLATSKHEKSCTYN